MPYKSESLKIAGSIYDKRFKLTPEQRMEIIKEYKTEGTAKKALARKYGVSPKTIYNILNPDKYQEQLKRYKQEQHWKEYYDKKKNTAAMREHRRYKHSIYTDVMRKRFHT